MIFFYIPLSYKLHINDLFICFNDIYNINIINNYIYINNNIILKFNKYNIIYKIKF